MPPPAVAQWERKENADTYNRDTYPQVLKNLAGVVEGTPEVRGYEVAFSNLRGTSMPPGDPAHTIGPSGGRYFW